MVHPQNAVASATGNYAGTLTTTDVQINGGNALAAGWWEFSADTDFRIAASSDGTAPSTGSTSRRLWAYDWIRLYSNGSLRVTMEAVSVAGTYLANRYETQ